MSNRFVQCKCVGARLVSRVLAAMLDRVRPPWRGGNGEARRMLLGAVLPLILVPALGFVAAQGVIASVIIFSTLPIVLVYAHFLCARAHSATKFFAVWALVSLVLIFAIFETTVVQMLEIRNDENMSFYILTLALGVCVYKTKVLAAAGYLSNDVKYSEALLREYDTMCPVCRKSVPSRTFHCQICHSCIIKRDLHCAWLDCCIGETNHGWYMLTLLTLIAQLTLCSNLILTTACHPFVVWGSIMLPDDCSDVYFDIVYGVCFVTAIYCVLCVVFALSLLCHEVWLITLGVTGHEWRQMSHKWGSCWGIREPRPFSHGCLGNWTLYLRGPKMTSSSQTV
ncbi:palmitoyltransferase ZDHHC23-B [Nilaparvata lugens]|uniref:palmitoyltransferase ZDHHC23-B n=1 Tax=Nilaparvata lugens TaxID=108931 RepID=UPI00193E7A47|nr:palmitoyltransferase ZDHHC23-B [Nilaparvata lugens]